MEEAKAVINLKEGIIELQGPVDFVQRYLDMYHPAIKGQSLPKEVAISLEKAKVLPRKRKAARRTKTRKGKRTTCSGAIRDYLETGFFDEPRSLIEIKQRLNESGLTFTDNGVRSNLRRLSLEGLLDTVQEGRSARYQRRAQF